MKNYDIYLVKSGRLDDFVGWTWLNLRAFDDLELAKQFADKVMDQIPLERQGEFEDVEIETITVEVE